LQCNSNSYFQKEKCTFSVSPSAMRPARRWRPANGRRFPRIGMAIRFPHLPGRRPGKSSRRSSDRARGSGADHAAAATGSRALAERKRSRIGPRAASAARYALPRLDRRTEPGFKPAPSGARYPYPESEGAGRWRPGLGLTRPSKSVRHTLLACAKSRHISVAVSTGSRWPARRNSKWKICMALL
jgi:hypothetical protein